MGLYYPITEKQRLVQKNYPQCITEREDISKRGAKITTPPVEMLAREVSPWFRVCLHIGKFESAVFLFPPAMSGFRGTSFMLYFMHSLNKDFEILLCARHRGN